MESEKRTDGILTGKRILILGVRNRRSLAHAAAVAATREGARCAFGVENDERTFGKAAQLLAADFGGDAPVIACDARDEAQTEKLAAEAAEKLGGLDGAVHAVAFAPPESLRGGYHEGASREAFMTAMDASAYSFTALARAAAAQMSGGGALATLTYLGAQRAVPNYNLMGVAKAALEASVRYLALSLGEQNIRVNAVSAGPVKTLAAAGIGGFGKILGHVSSTAPLRRNITAAEVADAVSFLLSDLARGITGEVLYVDAGFHAVAGFAEGEEEEKA